MSQHTDFIMPTIIKVSLLDNLNRGKVQQVLERTFKAYSEPQRHYHTNHHIETSFEFLNDYEKHKGNLPKDELRVLSWSILFHDVYYDPHSAENEELSADIAVKELQFLGYNPEQCARVHKAIIATKTHQTTDELEAIVLDIDLASLGIPYPDFVHNSELIRQEFHFVPLDLFIEGRSKLLREFFERPTLYKTAYFRERFDKQARANLLAATKA